MSSDELFTKKLSGVRVVAVDMLQDACMKDGNRK